MEKKQNLAIRQKSNSAEQEKIFQNKLIKNRKSKAGSHPEVFSGEGVLKIYSKFTEEHPCRSVILIKLQSSFI